MSYEPSHRKPPRQERWPNATPGGGWPAYRHGNGDRSWEPTAALAGSRNGYGAASYGYGDARAGRGTTADGYGEAWAGARYGGAQEYDETPNRHDGWDGYTQPGREFTGTASYPRQDEYPALDPAASSVLVAPDTMGEWWRQPDQGDPPGHRGAIVGVMMGVLATAVAIGVATLAAAFVRPQASSVGAVGGAFIDRIPATLKSHLMAHFGGHGQTVLLLGVIGLIAMALGFMARRNVSIGVAGLAAFGLLGAFIAVTRPESRASDVIPPAAGGLAGIAALLWLARASAPAPRVAALRPAYSGSAGSGGRRRTR